jgi:hypothetical protein
MNQKKDFNLLLSNYIVFEHVTDNEEDNYCVIMDKSNFNCIFDFQLLYYCNITDSEGYEEEIIVLDNLHYNDDYILDFNYELSYEESILILNEFEIPNLNNKAAYRKKTDNFYFDYYFEFDHLTKKPYFICKVFYKQCNI